MVDTLTRSCFSLNRLHRLKALRTGSLLSSITLCVVIGGRELLCVAYIHLFSLTASSLSKISSDSGRRPLGVIETRWSLFVNNSVYNNFTSSKYHKFACQFSAVHRGWYRADFWLQLGLATFPHWNCSSWLGKQGMQQSSCRIRSTKAIASGRVKIMNWLKDLNVYF